MKKKFGKVALLGFFVILVILFLHYAPSSFMRFQEKSKAYPKNGDFYCKELDAHLIFSSQSIILEIADGFKEDICVHPAGRFCTVSGEINMWYTWNDEEKYIEIEIISFPGADKEDIFYFFE